MSKININRNIFLEKEELLRLQKFLGELNIVNQVMLDNTSNWGIVRTVFNSESPDFKVEAGTNLGTIKIASESKAVDKNKNLIYQTPIDNISIPNNGNYYWVKISHKYNYTEEGEVSINTDGTVTGVNTKFFEVLRGQSTEVPVKIKFYKDSGLVNTSIYEVVSVDSDTSLLLSGTLFTAESGLKYIVIGSTPIGEVLTDDQKVGLYWYDSCNIELIPEETLGEPPVSDYLVDEDFYIARVRNVSNTISIEDKRGTQFLTFNVEGMNDKLDKNNNLSDLTDVAAARANLGVSSTLELQNAYFGDSGWQSMTRGVGAASAGYNIKIRRYGKIVTITGTFGNVGANNAPNALVSSILYSAIGNGARTTNRIYYSITDVASGEENRGIQLYVKEYEAGDTTLQLKVLKSHQNVSDFVFTITYIGE